MKNVAIAIFFLAGNASAAPINFTLPDSTQVQITEAPCERQVCAEGSVLLLGSSRVAKSYIKEITIRSGGESYRLDASNMVDPLFPKGAQAVAKEFNGFCYDARNCIFRGVFGDGGGAYAAEWRIINGKPIRTMLTDSADIVHFFMENPTPPRYH